MSDTPKVSPCTFSAARNATPARAPANQTFTFLLLPLLRLQIVRRSSGERITARSGVKAKSPALLALPDRELDRHPVQRPFFAD
ncbi:MAG TPA: hypothetical protein VGR00_04680, partial [Thermoanaerobaculia bacterium]|nr:hypothetical protein [Thermoanaerobaculia bacterium]